MKVRVTFDVGELDLRAIALAVGQDGGVATSATFKSWVERLVFAVLCQLKGRLDLPPNEEVAALLADAEDDDGLDS